MTSHKTVCISHRKDVDGLVAAALTKRATGAEVRLADYDDLVDQLRTLPPVDRLYICDLGLSKRTFPPFLQELHRLAATGQTTYIDHHPLTSYQKRQLQTAKVQLLHSLRECTSVLCYQTFQQQLPTRAALLAAIAAVADYLDHGPLARRLIQKFDRHLILFEAATLTYALARKGARRPIASHVVEGLSQLKLPHEMDNIPQLAVEQAQIMTQLLSQAAEKGVRKPNFAYMEADPYSAGNVASTLIGALDVPIGVGYNVDRKAGFVELSLRGSDECQTHLGRVAAKLSHELGGFGGGHAKASGARIPLANLPKFLTLLEKALKK